MNRMLLGAAVAATILGSGVAFAASTTPATPPKSAMPATTTPASTTTPAPAAIDYAARCTSLADQWKTAEAANASNSKLGKAKASATKGEKLCKSPKAASEKKGAAAYEAALRLLGVTPT